VALLGAFTGYLRAVAVKDSGRACSLLSVLAKRSLARLAASGPGKGAACSQILAAMLTPGAADVARQQANGRVTKVRVKGGRAFVVFRAPGAKLYQLTMVNEGEGWKAATVVASVLVPRL
jgi:hypothetical protein